MATLQMNFLSMKLGMQTNVSVFIPAKKSGRTLWLLADETGDDSQWLRESAITRVAEKYGFAVVFPCPFEKLYSEENPGQKFTSYITEELWAVCTGMFQLSQKREDNFIAGASLGAYGALKCALTAPEKYSKVVMLGGAFEEDIKGGYLEAVKKQMAEAGLVPPLALDDAPADDAELLPKAAAAKAEGKALPKLWIGYAGASPLACYAGRAAVNLSAQGFELASSMEYEGPDDWGFRDLALKDAAAWLANCGKEA